MFNPSNNRRTKKNSSCKRRAKRQRKFESLEQRTLFAADLGLGMSEVPGSMAAFNSEGTQQANYAAVSQECWLAYRDVSRIQHLPGEATGMKESIVIEETPPSSPEVPRVQHLPADATGLKESIVIEETPPPSSPEVPSIQIGPDDATGLKESIVIEETPSSPDDLRIVRLPYYDPDFKGLGTMTVPEETQSDDMQFIRPIAPLPEGFDLEHRIWTVPATPDESQPDGPQLIHPILPIPADFDLNDRIWTEPQATTNPPQTSGVVPLLATEGEMAVGGGMHDSLVSKDVAFSLIGAASLDKAASSVAKGGLSSTLVSLDESGSNNIYGGLPSSVAGPFGSLRNRWNGKGADGPVQQGFGIAESANPLASSVNDIAKWVHRLGPSSSNGGSPLGQSSTTSKVIGTSSEASSGPGSDSSNSAPAPNGLAQIANGIASAINGFLKGSNGGSPLGNGTMATSRIDSRHPGGSSPSATSGTSAGNNASTSSGNSSDSSNSVPAPGGLAQIANGIASTINGFLKNGANGSNASTPGGSTPAASASGRAGRWFG
jgi:hypothetical protein